MLGHLCGMGWWAGRGTGRTMAGSDPHLNRTGLGSLPASALDAEPPSQNWGKVLSILGSEDRALVSPITTCPACGHLRLCLCSEEGPLTDGPSPCFLTILSLNLEPCWVSLGPHHVYRDRSPTNSGISASLGQSTGLAILGSCVDRGTQGWGREWIR